MTVLCFPHSGFLLSILKESAMHRKLVKATTLFAADTPTHSEDPVFIDEDVDENCTLPRIPPPLLHFLRARYWISATNSDAETVLAGAGDESWEAQRVTPSVARHAECRGLRKHVFPGWRGRYVQGRGVA